MFAKDADPEDAEGVENGDGQDAHGYGRCGLNAVDGAAGQGGLEEAGQSVQEEPGAEGDGDDGAETGCQSVDAVDQVHGIDDAEPAYQGDENTGNIRKFMYSEEPVHAGDTDVAKDDQQQKGGDLAKKLCPGREHQQIIGRRRMELRVKNEE